MVPESENQIKQLIFLRNILKKISKPTSGSTGVASVPARLFIHIPKTAGTSLRSAAERKFGTKRVLRDYGHESDATSEAIKLNVYATADLTGITRAIEEQGAALIAGHFPITRYGGILGLKNTITIFRSPVDQVISHYRHAVRDHDYQDDLMTFAKQGGVRNLQSRMLAGVDPSLIGLVGLTEFYKETLELINSRWDWSLKHQMKNAGNRLSKKQPSVSNESRSEIESLNLQDNVLYKRARRVFNNTLEFHQNGIASDPRGAITLANTKHGVRGWAFDMMSEEIVNIEVLIDGSPAQNISCGEFIPTLACWKIPRHGYVGFSFKSTALEAGSVVEIRDKRFGCSLDIASVLS